MEETVGTLNLKIAQLEQKLQRLQNQRRLSRSYPDHLARLSRQDHQTRSQLQRLLEDRARFLNQLSNERGGRWKR